MVTVSSPKLKVELHPVYKCSANQDSINKRCAATLAVKGSTPQSNSNSHTRDSTQMVRKPTHGQLQHQPQTRQNHWYGDLQLAQLQSQTHDDHRSERYSAQQTTLAADADSTYNWCMCR
jgi:hypothetical protein